MQELLAAPASDGRRHWSGRAACVAALVAASLLLACPSAPAAAAANRLQLVSSKQLDPRLLELTMRTPAIAGQVKVRVLLPAGYAGSGRRYPVLYLLHGSSADASQWTTTQKGEQYTAQLPLIVVMPDGGVGGEYTNWSNGGAGGPPEWETFHIDQLLPWIDAHFRTIATRSGRAIAGESMGGLGTMEYAARFPDKFAVAASLSGAVSLASQFGQAGVAFNEALEGVAPGTIYGPLATEGVNLRAHSPTDLAINLGSTRILMYGHNGLPGGPSGGNPDPVEVAVHEMSQELDAALNSLRIPHLWDDLGAGAHSAPYFDQELALALPPIMATLQHPAPSPASITYASTAPTYSEFGWAVSLDRAVSEFSTLEHASARGFALSGSGDGTVSTPPVYTPGAAYRVALTPSVSGEPGAAQAEGTCSTPPGSPVSTVLCAPGPAAPPDATAQPISAGRTTERTITATPGGRLTIPVDLGPANTSQEYDASGSNASTLIYRTSVAITSAKTTTPSQHRACTSKRSVVIRVPGAGRIRSARVTVDRKRVRAHLIGRNAIRVTLPTRPRGRHRIVIRARMRSGATRTIVRHVTTCAGGGSR
jgi:S-formylglutathione hydrolase FrmB